MRHGPTAGARPGWGLLVLLCAAQFMVILDVTVVNVALPSIREALDVAPDDLQWVVTGYVLTTGGLLLLGGRLADLVGRYRVFMAGLMLFTAASLASALAPTSAALVAARVAQGLGAAVARARRIQRGRGLSACVDGGRTADAQPSRYGCFVP